jgi:hypothetical protein
MNRHFLVFIFLLDKLIASALSRTTDHCHRDYLGLSKSDLDHGLTCNRRMDDTTGNWDPWTYRPQCVYSREGSQTHSSYCVYTYASFRGGAGLSVLSTPEIAADAASLLPDPDPFSLHPQGQEYYKTVSNGVPKYEVQDLAQKGKGKGAVANDTIRRGEVVLREFPVILNLLELPPGIKPSQVGSIFDLAFKQLPKHTRERIMAMARKERSHFLNDILNSNGFAMTIGENLHAQAGLYPEIAVR